MFSEYANVNSTICSAKSFAITLLCIMLKTLATVTTMDCSSPRGKDTCRTQNFKPSAWWKQQPACVDCHQCLAQRCLAFTQRDSLPPRLPQAAPTLGRLPADRWTLPQTDPLVWLLQFVCNAPICCIFPIWMNKNKSFCLTQRRAELFCEGPSLVKWRFSLRRRG